MNLSEIRSQSRRLTKTNATNYVDADLDADINRALGEVHMMIAEAEGYKNVGGDFKVIDLENTTSLTEQQLGYNGEYPFPDDALRIEEAYLKYDVNGSYNKADIINKSDVDSEMFEDEGSYSESSPKIFIFRDSYFVRPLLTDTTVTDGIKLLITARQESLVNASDTPTFESNFHQLIPLKVAQDYYMLYSEKFNPRIDRKVQELESQIISFYQDRVPIEKRLEINKEERGLSGW